MKNIIPYLINLDTTNYTIFTIVSSKQVLLFVVIIMNDKTNADKTR